MDMIDKVWIYDVAVDPSEGYILLWGLTREGKVSVVYDDDFPDFFYIKDGDVDVIRSKLQNVMGGEYKLVDIEKMVRKLYGRGIEVVKVSAPENVLRNVYRGIQGIYSEEEIFEDDLRVTQKYLIYNGLRPAKWYEVEFDEPVINRDIFRVYRLKDISEVDLGIIPSLKAVSLDYIIASERGAPDPDREPIKALSLYDGKSVKMWRLDEWGNDYDMLRDFIKYLVDLDPDVIIGFQVNRIFYPYTTNRLKKIHMEFNIGRLPREIHQSILGHFSIGGRINIDLYEYVDDIPIFQRKTLEELAEYLSIDIPEDIYDPLIYGKIWSEDRDSLLNYLRWRVQAIFRAYKSLEDDIYVLSRITGIPPDYVLTASSGRQIESYIMYEAVERGELIPKVGERALRSYPGGLVIKPIPGLHSDIAVIDFKSMYPSLMIKYNISPETITVEKREDGIHFFDEVGIGVRRDVEGLFPNILRHLLSLRDRARNALKNFPRDSPEYRLLDAEQRIYKILANTVYGYMGWLGARWYSYEGASLVTYLGRQTISRALEYAKGLGLKVIYGDTDSLFIKYEKDNVDRLLKWISDELGLEAKIDKIYRWVLFTEAKKRYAGLTVEGSIDIVGLEYTRRDWCEYARELQYRVVEAVLRRRSKDEALKIFREYVDRLRNGKVPIHKLVIWEQITRSLRDYKANAPHIQVARELERRGWRISRGMFIGYVVLKGDGPIYRRSKLYLEVDPREIDINYYIYKQLIPVVHRILEPLKVSRNTLERMAAGKSYGLDMFMG